MWCFSLLSFSLSLHSASARGNRLQEPFSDSSSNPWSPQFDTLVQQTLDHFHVPGLSIAVVDGNDTFAKVLPDHL